MTELETITDFINSPAFALMSEEVKKESLAKQKELAMQLVKQQIAEHIHPLLAKYGLDLSYTFKETTKAIEKPKKEKVISDNEPSLKKQYIRVNPSTGLCIYCPDGSIIQESKASATFASAIRKVGAERVRRLNIILDKQNLVLPNDNYPHPIQTNQIERGYYVNVHSNTATKKRLLERISDALHLSWRIEIVE